MNCIAEAWNSMAGPVTTDLEGRGMDLLHKTADGHLPTDLGLQRTDLEVWGGAALLQNPLWYHSPGGGKETTEY